MRGLTGFLVSMTVCLSWRHLVTNWNSGSLDVNESVSEGCNLMNLFSLLGTVSTMCLFCVKCFPADMPTIPLLAELFRISAVFPPFRTEFVKFRFSIPFIWAIKAWYLHTQIFKKSYHQRSSVKLKLHHNKNRLGLRPRPQWGSLQCFPTPPSWISIYRPFGPLLLGLYCRPFGPPLWVIPLFGFQMLACLLLSSFLIFLLTFWLFRKSYPDTVWTCLMFC